MNTHGFIDETKPEPAPLAIVKPVDDLDRRATNILAKAQSFIISNRADYKLADDILSEGAAIIKGIKLIHDPICVATNTAHKTATGARKSLLDPVQQACTVLKNLMGNYNLIETKRIAEEQKEKEEIAQKEQKKAVADQVKAMKKDGAPKEVIAAIAATKDDPVQVTQEVDPLRSKNSFTADWDIEIIDKSLVPEYYKTVNEGAIRTAVKSAKGNMKIPGVKIFDTFKTRMKAS